MVLSLKPKNGSVNMGNFPDLRHKFTSNYLPEEVCGVVSVTCACLLRTKGSVVSIIRHLVLDKNRKVEECLCHNWLTVQVYKACLAGDVVLTVRKL